MLHKLFKQKIIDHDFHKRLFRCILIDGDLYFEKFGSTTIMFIKSFRRDVYLI